MLNELPNTDLEILASWLDPDELHAFFRTCRRTAALQHNAHALALWLVHVSALGLS